MHIYAYIYIYIYIYSRGSAHVPPTPYVFGFVQVATKIDSNVWRAFSHSLFDNGPAAIMD